MPTNEKEINNYLFDQLSLIEDIEESAQKGDLEATLELIAKKRRQIERKLYQNPPLSNEK